MSEDLRLRLYRTRAVFRETGQRADQAIMGAAMTTTPHIPLPAADALENLALPGVDRIAATVRRSLGR